ncbi:MAG: hypothetical protein ACD_4C00412G0003 [uncultured bacterium (gcode 4)]|uniref:Uncharacterized protein n=1 Tax=uncultured bacterium (gcode 4) TaxID=1234023 RepID=K2F521_9BACT|nr:MAG: hypothetical protein ACD_4C00412G0003 [uncultured bacterium (gcode 4)]
MTNWIYSTMSLDWLEDMYTRMFRSENISSSERRKVMKLKEITEKRASDVVNISPQAKTLNRHS